ncbi:MAG: ABC-ATPase domain-containing protein [bacterium]|nr:ABC-ATPase domain-containing protein [bacterium]
MADAARLATTLERLDGRGYKAYRDIEGAWNFAESTLFVDRVQSDPFAAPSKLRIRVDAEVAALPGGLQTDRTREIASASWLARAFREAIRAVGPRRTGTGKGGLIAIDAGGPEVLERTAVVFGDGWIEARIEVGLPAAGRRALGREAAVLLTRALPEIVTRSWIDRSAEDDARLVHFVDCVSNQEAIRGRLAEHGLVAFVGEGAILPRESGASERPMAADAAIPFEPPDAFAVELEVPHADAGMPGALWRGMGVPRGVVLLVGGGYHGKSTLLRALEHGVVPHVPGDGRETVVTDPAMVKVRAEDGRAVTGVDIQGFIDRLPPGAGDAPPKDTAAFSTTDASGSTSQAANIAEAIEAGATGLLVDEDTSATNFMVRDARMQALIHPKDEPITPFVDRVRALHDELGLSTVLVMGGSGDYFGLADAVIELKGYRPRDVTERAHAIAAEAPDGERPAPSTPLRRPADRVPFRESFDARRGRRDVKFSSRDREEIVYGTTGIDLRAVPQLFDPSQTRAIAGALHFAAEHFVDGERSLAQVLDRLEAFLDEEGLDGLDPFHRPGRHPGAFARPRRFEIASAINRMRSLRVAAR